MKNFESILEEIKTLLLLQTKDVLTLNEFCLYTGFSKAYTYRLLAKRAIPYSKPMGKTIFIKKTDTIKFLTSNLVNDRLSQEQEITNRILTSKKALL